MSLGIIQEREEIYDVREKITVETKFLSREKRVE